MATESPCRRSFDCVKHKKEIQIDRREIARAFAERVPQATLREVSMDYLAAPDGLANAEIDLTFAPEQAGHGTRRLTARVGTRTCSQARSADGFLLRRYCFGRGREGLGRQPGRMVDLCVRLLPPKRVRAMFPLRALNTLPYGS